MVIRKPHVHGARCTRSLAALVAGVVAASVGLSTGRSATPAQAESTVSSSAHVSVGTGRSADVVFAEQLANGWTDWSWGSSVDVGAVDDTGGKVVRWRTDRRWGGFYLHHAGGVAASPTSVVKLRVKALDAGSVVGLGLYGEDLRVVGVGSAARRPTQALTAGQWTELTVALSDLGASGSRITGLSLVELSGVPGKRLEVDDIRLTATAATAGTAAAAATTSRYPEIRPDNQRPNATPGRPTDPAAFFGHEGFRPYYAKINGNFTGTTEEILEWAAAKWGMDGLGYPDLAKAVAVSETWWRQGFRGRYQEMGILQVNPAAWPDAGPAVWSTAYSADYGMAVIRHHYDGQSWLGEATRGNLRNAVGAYYCGCGWAGADPYASKIFNTNESKLWRRPGVAPDWF